MLLDNKGNGKAITELRKAIEPQSKLAILSGMFSIYGYSALKKNWEALPIYVYCYPNGMTLPFIRLQVHRKKPVLKTS